ncbi:MAG: tRNA (adenosine(37)-N6)-threonylcarbamoyltransferase complex dimerization subunit type 1 TsaB [Candidatus Korobacteraceae bacterium]
MLVIAIDTSGRKGSVALCRGEADSFEVLQLTHLEGGTYSARLMPVISQALADHHLDKTAVDGFVVVSGPGSFTGLRVGLATVKGLCEVLQKPLATVSMLEAVALTYGQPGETATAILDAGRGEVYIGEYRVLAQEASVVREYIAKLDEFGDAACAIKSDLLTPDGSVADILVAAKVKVKLVARLQAGQIGRIGLRKLLAEDVADPGSVDVNYIRRSDAEIFSTPKP